VNGRVSADVGKIPQAVFEDVILPHLGGKRDDVLVGPRNGVDVGIVDIGAGRVMAVTTDPFFVMPELGWDRAAWFAVHIIASDAATSGLTPSHCTLDLNLPPDITEPDLRELWLAIDAACRDLDLAIVAGHTGRYDGCAFPTIGSATIMAFGERERFVVPAMARPGDDVIITKGAAIETTALLGVLFERRLANALGSDTARAAADLFRQTSVVRDAMVAVRAGVREAGVTGMHDATERGVLNALCEVADASGSGLIIDEAAIPVRPEVQAVCEYFTIDPYAASSEGTLVLTCRPKRTHVVLGLLEDDGIEARLIGQVTPREEGVRIVRAGQEQPLVPPASDPFWPAYTRALNETSP
jgi:hydrogenase expression/formation protein HypE